MLWVDFQLKLRLDQFAFSTTDAYNFLIMRSCLIRIHSLSLVLSVALGTSIWAGETKDGTLTFTEGEIWGVQQRTILKISEPADSSKSHHMMDSKSALEVLRLFLNGSALVHSVNESPSGQITHSYMVITRGGKIFGVKSRGDNGSIPNTDDELVFLKMIKNSEEWQRIRTPIEYLKIPEDPIEINTRRDVKLGRETWKISRFPNETVDGRTCEVYLGAAARGKVMAYEKTWLDRKNGKILKRMVSQEGENPFETTEIYGSADSELLHNNPRPTASSSAIPEEIVNASKITLKKVQAAFEDVIAKSLLTVIEMNTVPLETNQNYSNGPYWGVLVATVGIAKKPRLTHSIKITIKLNPRDETHDFFGFRVTPVHGSTLIVENERLRTIRVYIAADPGRVLISHKKRFTGDGDHFAFADHINYELAATKTQIIIATLDYTEEMKPWAKTLAGELDTNPLRELVWN